MKKYKLKKNYIAQSGDVLSRNSVIIEDSEQNCYIDPTTPFRFSKKFTESNKEFFEEIKEEKEKVLSVEDLIQECISLLKERFPQSEVSLSIRNEDLVHYKSDFITRNGWWIGPIINKKDDYYYLCDAGCTLREALERVCRRLKEFRHTECKDI